MRTHRSGFSLLEVILAVALSAIVMTIVAGGVEFHLRQLTTRKTRIEDAQLARAVLRRIADDLRAVVVDRPIDMSVLEALMNSSSDSDGDAGDGSSGDGGGENSGAESGAADAGSQDGAGGATAEDILASTAVSATPGIYGTSTELQIDLSRIPRYEEYAQQLGTNETTFLTTLSDVKTVSYFFLGSSGNSGSSSMAAGALDVDNLDTLGLPPEQVRMEGLGRRVVDRSVARFATENASYSYLDQNVELIAPEVMLIEFRYFDGEQWQVEWSTEENEGIPLAVEITLVMNERGLPNDSGQPPVAQNSSTAGATLSQYHPDQIYRLVVHLPAAEILPTEGAAADTGGGA